MHNGIKRAFLPLLALLALTGGCTSSDSDPGSQDPVDQHDTETSEHHRVLKALGVDVDTALAEPARDKDGNPLPEDFAPLEQKTMTLGVPRRELFIAGPEIDGKRVNLYDDGATKDTNKSDKTPYAALTDFEGGSNLWATGTEKVSTRADVDGDGFEEVVIFYRDGSGNWQLKVIDDKKDGYAVYDHQNQTFGSSAIGFRSDLDPKATWPDVAAADVDGDGYDEVIFAGRDGTVRILDDKARSFATLKTIDYNSAGINGSADNYLRVAAGDLTGDDRAEIVVVVSQVNDLTRYDTAERGRADYYIYADADNKFAELANGKVEFQNDSGTHTAAMADVAIGDVVGGSGNEIVIAGIKKGNSGYVKESTAWGGDYINAELVAATLEYADAKASLIAVHVFQESAPVTDLNNDELYYAPKIETVTVNTLTIGADRTKQRIAVNSRILKGDTLEALYTIPADRFYPSIAYGLGPDLHNHFATSRSPGMASVGDVTGDGNEEVIFIDQHEVSSDPNYKYGRLVVRVYGLDAGTFREIHSFSPEVVLWDEQPDPVKAVENQVAAVAGYFPIIQPVNVDEDSDVVQWIEGAHRVEFTQPQVIVAMAAAPCNPNWGQTDCGTAWGQTHSSGGGGGVSLTRTNTVTLGLSLEDRTFTQSGIETTATFETFLNVTASTMVSTAYSITYEGGNGEDSVVFTTTPVDYYGYRVVSSGEDDTDKPGNAEMIVGIPRKPITMVVSRDFYNATVGDGATRIDDGVFTHTVGDVFSYPTREDLDAKVDMALESIEGTVGEGNSTVIVTIEKDTSWAEEATLGVKLSTEMTLIAGSFLGGAGASLEVAGSLMMEHSNGASYEGWVSSMNAEALAENSYNFALVVYPLEYKEQDQAFYVLNYWVEQNKK